VTDWYWIRHGPTHEKSFVGGRDVPADLSDQSLIDQLANFLPSNAVVVSSDLIRSVTTADELANGRRRLTNEPNLREFNFGDWDGKHWTEVAESDPKLSRDYWGKPGDVIAPNGESWNMAAARARPLVDRLGAAHASIIAVAHFGIILTQVQRALGVSAYDCLANKIDNYSVTHLSEDNDQWTVNYINRLP
jgi:broad specificity phosphatase PhoE